MNNQQTFSIEFKRLVIKEWLGYAISRPRGCS